MALWEKLRFTSGKSTNRALTNAVRPDRAARVCDSVKDDGGRDKFSRILEYLRKVAVDSAVDDSLKSVSDGILVDKIVKERVMDINTPKQNNKFGSAVVDEMHTRIEKMKENANCTKTQMAISTHSRPVLDCFEDLPKEPVEGSSTSETSPKRIMIRSRL